jgi:hypothetical protein
MLGNTPDYEIHLNKKTDRVYLSKALYESTLVPDKLEGLKELRKPFRILSKVFDAKESHEFIKQGKELNLRITEGQRQEIVAKFYEDTRGIFSLQIQKYTTESQQPHKTYFTFTNDEISRLYYFIQNIALLPIRGEQHQKFDDEFLKDITLTKQQALQLITKYPDLAAELQKSNISQADILALGYRKEQLGIFHRLLVDTVSFEQYKVENKCKTMEGVWQFFFEKNTWIFGYGLNYIFNTPLEGKKLEQVVSGYNAFSAGKRIDALLQTRGMISSLCFVEIKTHQTELLKKEYRPESFEVSQELVAGIGQVQKTVQKSVKQLSTKIDLKDGDHNPIGKSVFLYQPRAVLVIGSLEEFVTEHGVNEAQYSSFELFRRNIFNPEIITFDELYERARYIVESASV